MTWFLLGLLLYVHIGYILEGLCDVYVRENRTRDMEDIINGAVAIYLWPLLIPMILSELRIVRKEKKHK